MSEAGSSQLSRTRLLLSSHFGTILAAIVPGKRAPPKSLMGRLMNLEFEWDKGSVETMKKTRTANQSPQPPRDMLPEYRFDYSKARPNRFAARLKRGSRAVVLDPDVAAVFSTPECVNAVLRAVIETMPQTGSKVG